ncbi:MAG TPA: hypothetical protein VJV96_04130 [Candidatus Angelobacter sp.]|nr:hypothetical protein [Candidatus Angelobacter sp.]
MNPKYKLVLAFILFAGVISAVGLGFDSLLLQEGVPRIGVLLLSNILTGLVAGFLFLQNKIQAHEKQKLLEERLQKVAEMNHHIRNALQVMVFYRHQINDPEAGSLLQKSIERIEWTLEEVLPRGWDIQRASAQIRQKPPHPFTH